MKVRKTILTVCIASCAFSAQSNEQADKKQSQPTGKSHQESVQQRIDALEERVEELEGELEETNEQSQALAIEVSQQGNRTSPSTFNPGIGVILNGKYLSASPNNYEFNVPGFFLGDEPGPGEEGLALGESEINFSSNVDDKFYASVTLAFGEGAEVEEAFLQTTSLPSGLQLKFGRFFSAIGYLNSHHAHADDFANRPLAYQAFLGKNFGDDGVQLSWLAPTDLYWESGFELYRGDSFPAAGAANSGKGATTLFSHIGGDIGVSQSWRAGISWLSAEVDDRSSIEDGGDHFSGDSDLMLLDFTWKWAPNGNNKLTNAKLQGEYFSRKEKGDFTDTNGVTQPINSRQKGWYIQGVYQFIPQWRVGARWEQLEADNLPLTFANTTLDNLGHTPKQISLMLDWSNSEFSRLRLQYSRDQSSPQSADLWTLQYIAAIGAHGAHAF